jgi:hypothetical protein
MARSVVGAGMLLWGSVLALGASLTGLIAFGSTQLYAELALLGFAFSLFTAICAAEARHSTEAARTSEGGTTPCLAWRESTLPDTRDKPAAWRMWTRRGVEAARLADNQADGASLSMPLRDAVERTADQRSSEM